MNNPTKHAFVTAVEAVTWLEGLDYVTIPDLARDLGNDFEGVDPETGDIVKAYVRPEGEVVEVTFSVGLFDE